MKGSDQFLTCSSHYTRAHTHVHGGSTSVSGKGCLQWGMSVPKCAVPPSRLTLGSSPLEMASARCSPWMRECEEGGGARGKGKRGKNPWTCLSRSVTSGRLSPYLGSGSPIQGLERLAVMGDLGGCLSTMHFPILVPKRGSMGLGDPGGADCMSHLP